MKDGPPPRDKRTRPIRVKRAQPNPPSLVSPKLHFYFPTIGEDNGDMIVKSGFDYRSGEARGTRGDTWSSRGARA